MVQIERQHGLYRWESPIAFNLSALAGVNRLDGPVQERALRLPLVWSREKAERVEEEVPLITDEPSDEDLVMRVCGGDRQALSQLFDRFARLLLPVVYRVLGDRGESEELVQDVFLHLYEKKDITFDPAKGTARRWLMQVACRQALDRRRFLERRRFWAGTDVDLFIESLSGGSDLEEELAAVSNRAEVQLALAELPEKQRTVIQLFFFEGMEFKEISEHIGETFGNVRHHYYRGLERLRKSALVQQLRDKLL